MNPEDILKEYIEGRQTGEDNKLRAAVGQLGANRSKELADAVLLLQNQLPMTIQELRQTIGGSVDRIIESNENLSKSNESHTSWIKWLTLALVLVGIAQIVVSILQ